MITGIIHKGSGLGNQLHRYVATRTLALDKGVDFEMLGAENFKGSSFMTPDLKASKLPYVIESGSGKVIPIYKVATWEEKTPYYNPEFNFIPDNYLIDGEFQDERYFQHRLAEILSWLNIREDLMVGFWDEICVINFRGGEYTVFPDLFLPKEYWNEAIEKVREIHPNVVFKVVTDDVITAKQFFPDFEVSHEIGDDWTSILKAHYVILSNSSFGILPTLLNTNAKIIIAPRYWAGFNKREWSRSDNYYRKFTYLSPR